MIPNCYACILHYVVLLHIKHLMSAGAQLDIVYCIVPNVCALDTAGYIHCMLCSMYCHMLVPWALLLLLFAVYVIFCHRHYIVTACSMLWQCCIRLCVVYMLLHGLSLWALLLYMGYYVRFGILCTVT